MKLATLINIYRELNRRPFCNLLREPRFLARRWNDAYAQYSLDEKTSWIEFNNRAIVGMTLARTVVYHEMIHQYVEEYLGLEEEDHHGPIFWRNYQLFAPKDIIMEIHL